MPLEIGRRNSCADCLRLPTDTIGCPKHSFMPHGFYRPDKPMDHSAVCCEICHATVAAQHSGFTDVAEAHLAWHRNLRQAILGFDNRSTSYLENV